MKTLSRKAKRTENSLTVGAPASRYLSRHKSAFDASTRNASNQSMQRLLIQAKSKVNQPDDKFEQEADRVADAVMRTPDIHSKRADPQQREDVRNKRLWSASNEVLDRQPLQESEKIDLAAHTSDLVSDVQSTNVVRSGGQPLPRPVQGFFESRLGYDFSQVRVHTDAQADRSARAVNADAYTMGHDVVFGAGQYSPQTSTGQRLLAHELTHVVQQQGNQTSSKLQRQEAESKPPASVIHERIDVRAQFALLRLFKGPPNDAKDAIDLFNDVDSGKIKGIFGDDLAIAATLAAKRGTVRWKLVPPGQDAVMLKDESSDTPVIIFREAAGKPPRLDQALLTVYRAHKASQVPAPTVVPAGHPTFTAEGSPSARPSRTIVQDANRVDTRDDLLVFDWTAQVKTDVPSPDCFEVGFLQTLTKNLVFADYSSGPGDTNPGLCMPFMPRLPIRDGFAATPVWFIAGNSRGIGFNVIGNCQPNISNVPPFTVPATSQAGVTTVDKPGGPFNIRHPGDNTKLLRQISEELEFKVWLAARLRTAPEGNVASYQFIKNATWVLERNTEFFHGPTGQVSFRFTRNETKVTEFGDGQGNSSPDLRPERANTEVLNLCVP